MCVCVCVSAPWWLYLAIVPPPPGSLIVNELNTHRCVEDEHIGSASPLCVSSLPLCLMSYKQWSHTFQRACFSAICHDVTGSQSTCSAAWGSTCACVWVRGWGGYHWEKHTCSVIICFCPRAWEHAYTSNQDSKGFLWYMLPLSDVIYSVYCTPHGDAVYCILCGSYSPVMVMMYSVLFIVFNKAIAVLELCMLFLSALVWGNPALLVFVDLHFTFNLCCFYSIRLAFTIRPNYMINIFCLM